MVRTIFLSSAAALIAAIAVAQEPGAAPEAAAEPVEVRARGRWILLDLEDGSSASQEFEIGAGGLRAGPLLGSLRGA